MRIYSEQQDSEVLWHEFKKGSREAFQILYSSVYPLLFSYGCKMIGDTTELEDCIQELFLKIWNRRATLSEVRSPEAYLIKALRRSLLDCLQKKKQRTSKRPVGIDYDNIHLSVEEISINNEIRKEQKRHLQQALNLLTKRQKEIIYLKFYKGMSYEEIGEALDINYQSIRNCVYEAIKVLKKDLVYVTMTLTPIVVMG